MVVKTDGRFLDDAQSLRAIVRSLPAPLLEEYESYGALGLEAVFPNRRMVVYTLQQSEPQGVGFLTFGDLSLDRMAGPRVEVEGPDGALLSVGVLPAKLPGRDLFLHVPQNFVFKWKGRDAGPKGVQFVPHYAILIKTRSKEHHQVEGHTYCVTLNNFRERFPGVNVRY